MTKLAYFRKGEQKPHAYANKIGAGGGTVLLLMAEQMPDAYWFKNYVIVAAPSLAISLAKLTNWVMSYCEAFFNFWRIAQTQRTIDREIRSLKLDPIVPADAIHKLELTAIEAKIQNVEQTIDKLNKLRRN